MRSSQIAIKTDGGGGHGMGHLRRAATVAWEFKQRGHAVSLQALSEAGRAILPPFPSHEAQPDIVLFDMPDEIRTHMSSWQGRVPVAALDYFGDAQPALTISVLERWNPPPPGRRLSGLKYAIIPQEIREVKAPDATSGVLIVIGGSDAVNAGPALAKRLLDAGLTVTLVEGPARQQPYQVSASSRLIYLKNPSDLAQRMAGCEWAVTSGGVSMTELLHLGKAAYAMPQTVHEDRLAKYVFAQGGLLGVGIDSLTDIPSHKTIESVGRRAKALVDGQGVKRIVDEIEGLLQ